MDEATAIQPVSYRSILQNRNYALLWVGQLVSVFGDRLHQIALLTLVGALTANNLRQVGLVFATIGLPSLLFGLFAGTLVDRWDRQRVMIVADLARALLVATIPTLARLDILWVYVITFLLTTTTLFFRPAKDGLIPNIVPEQGLLAANSLSSAADTTMDVLGYPLAGALVGGVAGLLAGARGIDLAFYIDAGTYLFSALMIYQMTIPRTVRAQEKLQIGNLVRMVGDGLRFVRSQAVLLTNTLVIVFGALVASGANTLAFGYAMDVTASGPFGYSVLEAAIGLGNVVGALAVGRWGGRVRKGPLILIGLVIMGAGYGVLALIAELWVAVGILVVSGVANMLFLIPSITLVQQLTPDAFRGRVLGFRGTLITTALITSNALMGLLGERYGVQPMFGVAGGLLALVGLLAFLVPSARDAN